MGHQDLIDESLPRKWLLQKTAHPLMGGFGKHAGDRPDLHHSSLGIATMSLLGHSALQPLDAALCISVRAKARAHVYWHSLGLT